MGAIGKQLLPRLAAAGHEVPSRRGCRRWHGYWGAQQPTRALRLAAGEAGVVLMTERCGAATATATRALAWQPAQPSWRQGSAR